jgi:hypothetical protein
MSDDHGSSNNAPAGLMVFGLLLVPASVVGQLLMNRYLIEHYGKKMANIPAGTLANIHLLETIFHILPLVGVLLLFPFGLYMLIKSHMGH